MKLFIILSICLFFGHILSAQETGGPYVTDENKVLLMHFDGNATNSANVGYNGIAYGSGVSYDTDGVHGQCLRLNNSTSNKQSWIEVPFYDERNFPAGSNGMLKITDTDIFIGGVDGRSNIQFDGWFDEINITKSVEETPIEYTEIPFFDDFENEYANWTTSNVIGSDVWHISGDDGIDLSKCARFYITSNPQQANDDWLLTPLFNTNGINNLQISFKYLYHGDGIIPEFYYSNSYDGNLSNSTWTQVDNSFWQNMFSWNDARIEIESPGETFVFAIRYQSTNEISNYILIDDFNIENFVPVVYEKVGESDHFEFYTTLSGESEYWEEIDEGLENSFQKYSGIWNIVGKEDFIDETIKTKIYYTEKSNIHLINDETSETKSGFFDMDKQSIYISPLNTPDKQNYYESFEGLALNSFAAYAKRHQLLRDQSVLYDLPAYFLEGFGLYEQGFRPRLDSIVKFRSTHPDELTHEELNTMNIFSGTLQKDIIVSYIEGQIICYLDYFGTAPYGSYQPIWNNFLVYFYDTTDVVRINKYASSDNFDIYCSSRDTMFIDNFFVWLDRTRQFYIDSFQLEINRKYNLVIYYDEKTGMDMTGYDNWNGGSGGMNISPHNFGIDDFPWLLAHEFGHVYNSVMYPEMPVGFYHEGMANFSGFIQYDADWAYSRPRIESSLYNFYERFVREPTLQEFINNPYLGTECNLDPYYYGLEFIRYLYELDGMLKIKEFFTKAMDFSVFSQSYKEIETGYIKRLKVYRNLAPTDTIIELPFYESFNDFSNGWTKPSYTNTDNWQINDGGLDGSNCARFYTTSDLNVPIESWLISPPLNAENMEQVCLSFDFARYGEGIELEVFYTDSFIEYTDSAHWTSVKIITMPSDWGLSNSGEITISNPPDTLFIGLRKKSTGEQHLQLYIDNFKVQSYVPLVVEKVGETEHFEFYSESINSNYWDSISPYVDHWFKELCSYWDRPQTDPLFLENEKVKIYLTDKNVINEQLGITLPDWKYGGYILPDEIYLAIPPGGDGDIYEGSFETVAKNIFSQLVLKKRSNRDLGGYWTDYYSEGFGLYQSGYRPNRDSILNAIDELGRLPLLSDIENTDEINKSYKKDLLVSFVESQLLAKSYQCLYIDENKWQVHLKYYYQVDEDKRMGLMKSSENFDIYAIARDTIYLDAMAQQLEELRMYYTSLFELNIYNRFNAVIYPDLETALEMNDGCYSMGVARGGDLFSIISRHNEGGGSIPHEFWHVIHFHMRPYNGFPGGYFIMEGMARYMPVGTIDIRYIYGHAKIEGLFYDYSSDYGREPTLMEIMENPLIYDPYFFGQLFYNYLIPNIASHIEVKNFFLGRCDWSAFNKSYEEIARGYIHYIKSLVNYTPPDSLTSIPFVEPFNDFFNGWSKPSYNNPDNWQIDDGGLDGGNCARFYTSSDLNEPIESWLISPPLNTDNMEQIILSFDFARYGEGIELEVFYTNSFKGYTDSTNWTSIQKIEMPESWDWSNSGEISITNILDTVFIGFRMNSTGEQHLQLYIDNFEVKIPSLLEKPVVVTDEVSSIEQTSALLHGNVTSNGGAIITQLGFYWSSINYSPSLEDNVELVSGTTGQFSVELSDLVPETTYYYKAFATNIVGTAIGDVKHFETRSQTGVELIDSEEQFFFYVNSIDGKLHFNSDNSDLYLKAIELIDITGRVVFRSEIQCQQIVEIQMPYIKENAFYILKLTTNKGMCFRKIKGNVPFN